MTRDRAPTRLHHLLERDRELAEIDECIAGAAAGEGSFLVLEGRAGMGKSALLAETRRRAAEVGLTTCWALGSELEDEFAFGVVRQLFEPVISTLSEQERAHAFEGAGALAEPVLGVGGEPAARGQFAALHGLYWLAGNLSGDNPLLLAVDDAHWADTASLRWLAYVLNRLEGLPMLVAIGTRSAQFGPQGEVLATVLAHPRARIVQIGPLGGDSVAALVRSALGADPDPTFTAACLQATAGNPFGLNELLRDLRARGVAPTSAAAASLDHRAPDAIARRVVRDLGLLGDQAESLANALAVIGDGTELRQVARLAALDVDRAAEAADDLRGADLVGPESPPRFTHPLLRAAVFDRLAAGTRQRLHRRSAEILASEAGEAEAVAAHLMRCEPGQSTEMVHWLTAAAPVALRRGDPETAISYLRRAITEETDRAPRAVALAQLGWTELAAGDLAAAGHLREALADTQDKRARGGILAELCLAVLDRTVAIDLLNEAIREFQSCDRDAAERLECFVAVLSCEDPRLASSVEGYYPRLRDLARSGGPNAELARVSLAALLSERDGNRDEALSLIGKGFDWKVLYDGRPIHGFGLHWVVLALGAIDELDHAIRFCDTAIRVAAAEGYPLAVATLMNNKAWAEFQMGLLADAEADATAAFEMSQQNFSYYVPTTTALLAQIHFERGRQGMAYEAIEGIDLQTPGVTYSGEAMLREIRGRLRWARGWRQRAVDDLRESGRLCELLLARNPINPPWRSSLAAVLTRECPDEARQLAQDNLANAHRSGIPRAIGVALCTLAGLDQSNRIDLLRAAIKVLEESPAQLDRARALTDLGSELRRQGHRVEARQPLREALDIAARCGAVPLVERVQAEAVAAGARPRRPRLQGVDALTPSELRVARLAAEGQSNREIAQNLFITAKTVADHLNSTYGKLEITSRHQLSTALALRK